MTSLRMTAKGRRTAAALGAVSAGLLVLAACDKPTPIATVTVGSDSVNTEAACYKGGDTISEAEIKKCLAKDAEKSLTVGMDDKVRFGVDPEIADNGWTLFINGQQAEQEPYKKTYRTIPGNAFFSAGQSADGSQGAPLKNAQVSIVETDGSKLKGIWHFKLKKGE
ncbi:hypothetical protein DSC45_27715 [Streptomyces sp. YIM 130001]|uniref:DUF2771 domain-containing protein n=1 Tax=Streptomyces sp. YIM 130001 TaxID=2259644 RepID=UPI000E65740E|nr:DUF2771 domain-containing protein [Streptomyces sp. YIM 130001]RII11702.1 hypothetical protein DSC45_27715 [Streptomyces sp. YIM 130001]